MVFFKWNGDLTHSRELGNYHEALDAAQKGRPGSYFCITYFDADESKSRIMTEGFVSRC